MTFSVRQESPRQAEIENFIAALNGYLNPLSPQCYQFQLTVDEMDVDDVHLFVVRDDAGTAVAMGALAVHADGLGEVKRMWTEIAHRGQGLGKVILAAVEEKARALGLRELKLETGAEKAMPAAHGLYKSFGFAACGPFLDYPQSEYSAFFQKSLTNDKNEDLSLKGSTH